MYGKADPRLINILSIISLSIFDLLLVPMMSSSQHSSLAERRTHMAGLLFEVLFSWPVFVICFWINVSRHACDRSKGRASGLLLSREELRH